MRLVPAALLLLSAVSLRCDALGSGDLGGCSGAVQAPTRSDYRDLPRGRGRSDGLGGRQDAAAFTAVLAQGPFEGASYIQIGSENDDVYVTMDRFYPDSLTVGGSTLVSVYNRSRGGGPGYMRIDRLSADAIEGTFGGCTRIVGTGGIQGPGSVVLGGFHVAR